MPAIYRTYGLSFDELADMPISERTALLEDLHAITHDQQ